MLYTNNTNAVEFTSVKSYRPTEDTKVKTPIKEEEYRNIVQ